MSERKSAHRSPGSAAAAKHARNKQLLIIAGATLAVAALVAAGIVAVFVARGYQQEVFLVQASPYGTMLKDAYVNSVAQATAQGFAKTYGAALATYSQLQGAYNAKAQWCYPGAFAESFDTTSQYYQQVGFPMQESTVACGGAVGITTGNWYGYLNALGLYNGGVLLYGRKPSPKSTLGKNVLAFNTASNKWSQHSPRISL